MRFEKSEILNFSNLFTLLICFFPFSTVIGNLIVNINILLICILGLIFKFKNSLNFKSNYFIKILFFFFSLVFITSLLAFFKNYDALNETKDFLRNFLKSIFFLRFLLLVLIIKLLIDENLINFKFIFYFYGCFALFIGLDTIYQNFNGYNILGYQKFGSSPSGVYFDELIVGSYIQRFSFFAIFFITLIFKDKKILSNFLLFLSIVIIVSSSFYSSNRMPFVLFIFGLIIFSFFEKKYIFTILISLIVSGLFIDYTADKRQRDYYISSFLGNTKRIAKTFFNYLDKNNNGIKKTKSEEFSERGSGHLIIFKNAFYFSKENKTFGVGLKNYYKYCQDNSDNDKVYICTNHPHNYYLDILVSNGILNLLIFTTLYVLILLQSLKVLFFTKNLNPEYKKMLLTVFITFLLELLPIRSSGAFFTTGNASFIFLILAFVIAMNSNLKKINI